MVAVFVIVVDELTESETDNLYRCCVTYLQVLLGVYSTLSVLSVYSVLYSYWLEAILQQTGSTLPVLSVCSVLNSYWLEAI
jgi:hypothetical protein